MEKKSIIVGALVLMCTLSLVFAAGCATKKAAKIPTNASMNDILAEETAKSKAEFAAMKAAAAAKAEQEKAAQEKAAKIPENASMNDILAEETAKSKAEFAAMKAAAAAKAEQEKAAKGETKK